MVEELSLHVVPGSEWAEIGLTEVTIREGEGFCRSVIFEMSHDVEMIIDRCGLRLPVAIVAEMITEAVEIEAGTGTKVVERADQDRRLAGMGGIEAEVQEDETVMKIRPCPFPREIRATFQKYRLSWCMKSTGETVFGAFQGKTQLMDPAGPLSLT